MSARVEISGNTYPIKDRLKYYGFGWDKVKKLWVRPNGYFDIEGHTTYEAVELLIKGDPESRVWPEPLDDSVKVIWYGPENTIETCKDCIKHGGYCDDMENHRVPSIDMDDYIDQHAAGPWNSTISSTILNPIEMSVREDYEPCVLCLKGGRLHEADSLEPIEGIGYLCTEHICSY